MGCDINPYAEVRHEGAWHLVDGSIFTDPFPTPGYPPTGPFAWRDYGMFGFLADFRNYSHVPVIAEPRGLPDDATDLVIEAYDHHASDNHSASWLTVAELQAYDYDQVFWDRRVSRHGNGAALADEGEGKHLTVREFLGTAFFTDLEGLVKLGDPEDVRVVFWFDC